MTFNIKGTVPHVLLTRNRRGNIIADMEQLACEAFCLCYDKLNPQNQRIRNYVVQVIPAEVSDDGEDSFDLYCHEKIS